MGEELGDTVGTAGVERRRLALRYVLDTTEHLARRGLVEARLRLVGAQSLEQSHRAESVDVGGQERLIERNRDEALGWPGCRPRRDDTLSMMRRRLVVLEELERNELHLVTDTQCIEILGSRPGAVTIGAGRLGSRARAGDGLGSRRPDRLMPVTRAVFMSVVPWSLGRVQVSILLLCDLFVRGEKSTSAQRLGPARSRSRRVSPRASSLWRCSSMAGAQGLPAANVNSVARAWCSPRRRWASGLGRLALPASDPS